VPVIFQIALGGALGASLRYATVVAMARLVGAGFPWGTMAVNVIGSFLMGIVAVLVLLREDLGLVRVAPFLMPGLLGGFTTFSAFSLETLDLFEDGRILGALAYVGFSVVLGITALMLGLWLARGWLVP
jgi:CrcB protein